jgi:myo-inositol-1(or 4)-monophosphatase
LTTQNPGTARTSEELVSVARTAARAVAGDIRAAFSQAVEVEYKSSAFDPVTEVDRAAEQRIWAILSEAFPEAAILGEEFGAEGESPLRWYIDPIDGTHNFIAGIPYISTSIAAELNGQIIAGVVHDPLHDECFWATRDGAWVNEEPLPRANEVPGTPGVLTAQPFQGLRTHGGALEEVIAICGSYGIVRNPGSLALQLAHVAAGRASAAFELAGAAPWDIAGGMALAQGVGCFHARLGQAPRGVGEWASPSYLVSRGDVESARATAGRLKVVLDQGKVPAIMNGWRRSAL